jgi:hypothetical protein
VAQEFLESAGAVAAGDQGFGAGGEGGLAGGSGAVTMNGGS